MIFLKKNLIFNNPDSSTWAIKIIIYRKNTIYNFPTLCLSMTRPWLCVYFMRVAMEVAGQLEEGTFSHGVRVGDHGCAAARNKEPGHALWQLALIRTSLDPKVTFRDRYISHDNIYEINTWKWKCPIQTQCGYVIYIAALY